MSVRRTLEFILAVRVGMRNREVSSNILCENIPIFCKICSFCFDSVTINCILVSWRIYFLRVIKPFKNKIIWHSLFSSPNDAFTIQVYLCITLNLWICFYIRQGALTFSIYAWINVLASVEIPITLRVIHGSHHWKWTIFWIKFRIILKRRILPRFIIVTKAESFISRGRCRFWRGV